MNTDSIPRGAYQERLNQRRGQLHHFEQRNLLLANTRLGLFVVGGALAAAAFAIDALSLWWTAVPMGGFVVLVLVHDTVVRREARAREAVTFYELGLRRLDGTWSGTGITGDGWLDPEHPFAADLDLFGEGSLFELLCGARTHPGEQTLAQWLLSPATPQGAKRRQEVVEELRDRLDLRERLHLVGGTVRGTLRREALCQWGEAPSAFRRSLGFYRGWFGLLSAAVLGAAGGWALTDTVGPVPFLIAVTILLISARIVRRSVEEVTGRLEDPREQLGILATVLGVLEGETFESPRGRELRGVLVGQSSASFCIAKLETLATWLDAERNQFFAPIGIAVGWRVHFSVAIEAWRRRHGHQLGRWLEALGDLEALVCLSRFTFETPQARFPEFDPAGPSLVAEQICHPLLPASEAIPNTVELSGQTRALVVSGSNMSGKSTLLRTIGTNAVLAFAGAPVLAERMVISSVTLGATLRINDSLAAGRSRFFAEIKRLQKIQDLADADRPVLFLLDEILHGTNSHDRRVGAEALIRALLDAGSIGLVTTHDLALAEAAEGLAPRAMNVHFTDTLQADRIVFDYRLRPGVVTKSNALELMRRVGLRV